MPELPEVETLRRMLRPQLQGKYVESVSVREKRLRWPVADELADGLTGCRILDIGRRGKYLLIETDGGTLIVHLGMSGTLLLSAGAPPPHPGKHDHFICRFRGDLCMTYNDPRRFGSLHWVETEPLQHPLLRSLGCEPLQDDFSDAYLSQQCAGRSTAVKTLLMNARIVVGIGNIYACEALFQARIRPHRLGSALEEDQVKRLRQSVCSVLRRAIEAGGTTIRDFKDVEGKPGYFAQELQVYGREGLPCHRCGAEIVNEPLGGRATCFCPDCQQ